MKTCKTKLSFLAKVFLALVHFYQRHISPLTKPSCKYIPSCSNYAIDAVKIHGFIKGFFLFLWRFFRCNPFSAGGYDPVPDKKDS